MGLCFKGREGPFCTKSSANVDKVKNRKEIEILRGEEIPIHHPDLFEQVDVINTSITKN